MIFQNKTPVLFKLNDNVEELLHDIASRFIVPKVLRELKLQEIDVSNPEIHCPDEELFVGFLTRRHLLSEEALSTHKTKQFFKDARAFYVRSFQKGKEKFPMRDQILTNLSVVNPENQDDVKPEQILTLAERFPNVMKVDAREQLNLEILDYVSTNLEALVPICQTNSLTQSAMRLRFLESCSNLRSKHQQSTTKACNKSKRHRK